MWGVLSVWRWFRSSAVAEVVACAIAATGAVIAALISGVSALWVLAGAAVLAGSGVLAPMVASSLSNRKKAQETLQDVQDARTLAATGTKRQIAALLDPHAGVVPFTGREHERARLIAWCQDDQAGHVRLVTGGGGVGKTRLALWLERELTRSGWSCVWVGDGRETGAVGAIRGITQGRVLLIVDYAETRLGLEEMLRATATDKGRALQVLLLARQVGDWWQLLQAGDPVVRTMVVDANQFRDALAQEIDADVTHREVVLQAVRDFAKRA